MTREEAIKAWDKWRKNGHSHSAMPNSMALVMAYLALRGPTREQVEKVWGGEWEDMREAYKDVPKRRCSRCKNVFIGLDTPFCEVCGAPMTDKAVDILMKRLEALHEK